MSATTGNGKASAQPGPPPGGRPGAAAADRTIWGPALIGRLVALWNAGESAQRIAARLGLTCNAVIGKVYRLQLCRRNAAPTAERLAAQAEARRRQAIRGLYLKVAALRAADPPAEGAVGPGR